MKFIPKGGKLQTQDPKSVRPISLTSFMLKIMEKNLDRWIRDNIADCFPLSSQQYAYQEGKSTIYAIKSLTTRIQKVLDNGKFSINAFIDIEGAFNNLSFVSIKDQLMKRRVDEKTINWIMKMLNNRLIHMTLGETSVILKASKGCPQGGVLSALLCCLVADSLIKDLQEGKFEIESFADDIVFGLSGFDPGTVCSRISDGLKIVENWCYKIGLRVNPTKTVLVPFTAMRKFSDKLFKPKFFGKYLNFENHVKYLGMILDSKLTWNEHLKFLVDKARRALFTCKTIIGRTWGLKPGMMK